VIPQLLSTPVHWTEQMAQRHKTTGMAPTSVTNCRLVLCVSLFCTQSCLFFLYVCCPPLPSTYEKPLLYMESSIPGTCFGPPAAAVLGLQIEICKYFSTGFLHRCDLVQILWHFDTHGCSFLLLYGWGRGGGGEIWVILFLAAKAEVCMAFCCGMTLEKMDC
jgi:hypothetical protein